MLYFINLDLHLPWSFGLGKSTSDISPVLLLVRVSLPTFLLLSFPYLRNLNFSSMLFIFSSFLLTFPLVCWLPSLGHGLNSSACWYLLLSHHCSQNPFETFTWHSTYLPISEVSGGAVMIFCGGRVVSWISAMMYVAIGSGFGEDLIEKFNSFSEEATNCCSSNIIKTFKNI